MPISVSGTLTDRYRGELVRVTRERSRGGQKIVTTIATSTRIIISKLTIPQQIARTGQVSDQFLFSGVFPIPIPEIKEGDIITRDVDTVANHITIGGALLTIGGEVLSIGSNAEDDPGVRLSITDSNIQLGVHEVLLR